MPETTSAWRVTRRARPRTGKGGRSHLVVRENERIGDDNVLATRGGKDDDFGNVVWRKGLAAAGCW